MTNKTRTKPKQKKTVAKAITKVTRKLNKISVAPKSGPFASAGGMLGGSLGGLMGFPQLGRHVGRFLGSGLGTVYGTGDYKVVGGMPEENSLSGTIPQFSSTHASNVVRHREYLGDLFSTVAFTNQTFPIQPGISTTFPWLSTIAGSYQQYRITGMLFEFNPMTTDFANSGIPGYVIMATNYNSDAVAYTTKQQMENSEFAVSVKPTCKLIHMIECKPSETANHLLYTRTANPPTGQDLRLYDLGLFQVATGGAAAGNTNLGELWVTYEIEFLKPLLYVQPPFSPGSVIDHYQNTNGGSGGTFFGASGQNHIFNKIGTTITGGGTILTFPASAQGWYLVLVYHNGTAANYSVPSPTLSSSVSINNAWNDGQNVNASSQQAITTPLTMFAIMVIVTPGTVPATITYTGGSYPTTSFIDVVVSSIGPSYA